MHQCLNFLTNLRYRFFTRSITHSLFHFHFRSLFHLLMPIFFLSSFSSLCCADIQYHEPKEVASTEGLPSSLVNGAVCVISGEYSDSVQDIVLQGPETFSLQRSYGSNAGGNFGLGWSVNHYERLILGNVTYKNQPVWIIGMRQPSGTQLDYIHYKTNKASKSNDLNFELLLPKGLTNGAAGLSGRTNLKNQEMHYYPETEKFMSISGAGNKRKYKKISRTKEGQNTYSLNIEENVNGSIYEYEGKNKNWDMRILCKNKNTQKTYSHVKLKYKMTDKKKVTHLTTSNGQNLAYHYTVRKHKQKLGTVNRTYIETDYERYLSKVQNSYAPTEHYYYTKKTDSFDLHLTSKYLPKNRFIQIKYYRRGDNPVGGIVGRVHVPKNEAHYRINRVKSLAAPVGTDNKAIITHRFDYHCKEKYRKNKGYTELLDGWTDVYDAYDHRTKYEYDEEHRLTAIKKYKGTSHHSHYSSESYIWENKDSQKGNLLAKIFKDKKDQIHQARYFSYDKRGNVVKSKLYGNLSGQCSSPVVLDDSNQPIENGVEYERKTYVYSDDGLNLLLKETNHKNRSIAYEYIPGTDHVQAKYTMVDNEIRMRQFFAYDGNYVLIQQINDDGNAKEADNLSGVTERQITEIVPTDSSPFGLPRQIDEFYFDFAQGEKKFLRSTLISYNLRGQVLEKSLYDANRALAYTLYWKYDDHGNVIEETDAMGVTVYKNYDSNDNLIYQKSSALSYHIDNAYDFSNRLIQQKESHEDGKRVATYHTYDYLGNCISTIDIYGNETRQVYDEFGRVIETHFPPVLDENGQMANPMTRKSYDIAGNPIAMIDAKGRIIKSEYNIRRQPTCITYPDGVVEKWIYHKDGQLKKHISKDGVVTEFQRDRFGRVVKETVLGPDGEVLKSISNYYNALHLLESKDAEGVLTHYTYDAAGHLESTRRKDRLVQYLYDSLGRIAEVREWYGPSPDEYRATIKKYDVLDRVVEEQLTRSDGTILHLSRYEYDVKGNQTLVQTGEITTRTEYDSHNNPVKIVNGAGHATHSVYNTDHINGHGQRVLKAITTDPLGYQTFFTHDVAGRLVTTTRKNPFGETVEQQTVFYDLCGNQCRVVDDVLEEGKKVKSIETHYEYSARGQVTALIEAVRTPEQKITKTEYNRKGQKSATIKPDGVKIAFEYDPLGRLRSLQSSDHTVSYVYEYNVKDQVTKVSDLVLNQITLRGYNINGDIISEALGNGLTLGFAYDRLGRIRTILLPDKTGVEYLYDAVNTREICRLIDGHRKYSHQFLNRNLAGQVEKIQLPGHCGLVGHAYDGMGRRIESRSPHFDQNIPVDGFDSAGNLLKYQAQGVAYQFAYDHLYQVKSEQGHANHTYRYDSLLNRLEKDGEKSMHNSLHQVLSNPKEKMFYDRNGNLIKRMGSNVIEYGYDALDRLVSIKQHERVTKYCYDSFNRRLMKKGEGSEDQLYFYLGQEELGKWVSSSIQELRLIGDEERSPMIGMELNGKPYVPLSDISGNVVCLLDHDGQVVERYRYTIFGESEVMGPQGRRRTVSAVANPWQYANKRLDEESGLVSFGLRYYDPALGRWITADPAGYADGSNLYAYVHNSPLVYWDQYGLFANSFSFLPQYVDYANDAKNQFNHTIATDFCGAKSFEDLKSRNGQPFSYDIETHYFEPKYGHRSDFEMTSTINLNKSGLINPNTQQPFQLKGSPNKGIAFVNGILNDHKSHCENLAYLGSMSDYNIHGVHCGSYGIIDDGRSYYAALNYFACYEGVRELHKLWYDYFANAGPNATFLTICHSRGSVYVRNALMTFPKELRDRIEVIAIAPGGYIDENLCKSVKHFVSSKDLVAKIDKCGREACAHTITYVEGNSWFSDHNFTSKIYRTDLENGIQKYLNK